MRDTVAAWQSRWNTLEDERLHIAKELQLVSAKAMEIPYLEADLENLRTNYKALTDQYAALETDWKRRYGLLETEWRGKLATAEKEMLDLRVQLQASARELETLKTNLDSWSQKYSTLEMETKKQIVALTSERDQLRAEIETREAERGKLQTEVIDWSTKHAAACLAIDNHVAHVRQLTDRVAAVEAEQKSRYDQLDADWKARFSTLEARYRVAEERLGGAIERIEGIGGAFGQRLRSIGIDWVVDLIDHCSTADGRAKVAEKIGITTEQLLTWTNMADLLRIPGMTADWAELLHAAGVDSVKELKQRVPENLQQKMEEVNATAERTISSTVPNVVTVNGWVQHAKTMEYQITH